MKKLIVLGAAATAVLVACSGGGSTPTVVANVANPFAADAGTYKSNCSVLNAGQPFATSESIVAILDAPVGSDMAKVTVQSQLFTGETCGPATAKTDDITVRGDLSSLTGTKVIAGAVGEKSGAVKTVEFAFTGLTLSMGSFNFPTPTLGAKAKAGYLIEGNRIYFLSGARAPDGLSPSFSNNFLTKQ